MIGLHNIKHWSSTQNVVALSSGEAELTPWCVHAVAHLLFKALLCDLGHETTIALHIDASAVKGISPRAGLGKIRHLEPSQL